MEPTGDSIVSIERSLFNTLLNVTGRSNFDIFSYDGRVIVFRLLEKAKALQEEHTGAVAWLEAAAEEFTRVLVAGGLMMASESPFFSASVEEMKADMERNGVDTANLTLDALAGCRT